MNPVRKSVNPGGNEGGCIDIPGPLAKAQRLSMSDWRVTSVQIWHDTMLVADESGLNLRHAVTGTNLSAELVPFTESAMREVRDIAGQCFFVQDHLFQIGSYQIALSPSELPVVEITCRSIWKIGPADSDACDSPKHLQGI